MCRVVAPLLYSLLYLRWYRGDRWWSWAVRSAAAGTLGWERLRVQCDEVDRAAVILGWERLRVERHEVDPASSHQRLRVEDHEVDARARRKRLRVERHKVDRRVGRE